MILLLLCKHPSVNSVLRLEANWKIPRFPSAISHLLVDKQIYSFTYLLSYACVRHKMVRQNVHSIPLFLESLYSYKSID